MQNRHNAHPRGDDGPPTWRPQPGEIPAGVIDRYSISDTLQGPVRTVMVIEERTGERICLRLASTSLLELFAQFQPHPGERIDVRFRWHAPDQAYQRWRLLMDRPALLDLSPLGGKRPTRRPGTGSRAWRSPTQHRYLTPRRPHKSEPQAAQDVRGSRPLGDPWHR
jgi:hypothetical protein